MYWHGFEEIETLLHHWWEYKMTYTLVRDSLAAPQQVKHRINVWLSNSTPKYNNPPNWNKSWNKYLYTDIHSGVIHKQPECLLIDDV